MLVKKVGKRLGYYAKAFISMHVRPKTTLQYVPEYVAIEVTNSCNFACSFCPQSDPDHHQKVPKAFLNEASCRDILQKLRDANISTNLMHWTLDGEPFMHKGFADLVKLSAEFGFSNTYFATNGMLCTVERLLEFPLDQVRLNLAIDFCADKAYFEDVRGTKNSWGRVKNNIQEILADERLGQVHLEITDISSYSQSDPTTLLSQFESLKDLFEDHPRISFRTRTFHNATGFLPKSKGAEKYHLCPYPWTHLRIASNADVVACCRDLQHKTVLGNLKEQSVEDIWNGPPMQHLRRALLDQHPEKIAACQGCDLPFDDSKFTASNVFRAARGRMQLFAK